MTVATLSFPLDRQGIATNATIFANLGTAPLVEHAIRNGEGVLAADGPLVVETGKHTGRSAKDKFIVQDAETVDSVWWGKTNVAMSPAHFAALKQDFLAALAQKDSLYVADLFGGSQPEHRVNVRVINELAWHNLFIRTLLVRPEPHELGGFAPEYTIIDLPTFRADPARHGTRGETVIAVNFTEKLILIGGTAYAGEMKKSVFGILNYLLPPKGVMPMHCSANIGNDGRTAVFFGLSGTGKTTLSADASRTLIGDDEHGWSDTAVFNFEGGCYAKMIRLSAEAEPEIFATTKRFGTVLENVVIDPDTRKIDLDDNSLAENSRGVLPDRLHSELLGKEPRAGPGQYHLPHRRRLWRPAADRAAQSGPGDVSLPVRLHRARRGHRNRRDRAGSDLLDVLRRAVHAAPSFGLRQSAQGAHRQGRGQVLAGQHRLDRRPYGIGHQRMPIKATRALLNAALDGSLNNAEFRKDPNFGFEVPVAVPGSMPSCSIRAAPGPIPTAYDKTAQELVHKFIANFAQFEAHVDESVRKAAPIAA